MTRPLPAALVAWRDRAPFTRKQRLVSRMVLVSGGECTLYRAIREIVIDTIAASVEAES